MALCLRFTCDQCGFHVDSWDDGNPYVEDQRGKRHYFYHPSREQRLRELARGILGHEPTDQDLRELCKRSGGNAADHICTACGTIQGIDPERDQLCCCKCKEPSVIPTWELAGAECLKCGGRFASGLMHAVS